MAETVFTYAARGLKFGSGASAEIGFDLMQLVGRTAHPRVLVVSDPGPPPRGTPLGSPSESRPTASTW